MLNATACSPAGIQLLPRSSTVEGKCPPERTQRRCFVPPAGGPSVGRLPISLAGSRGVVSGEFGDKLLSINEQTPSWTGPGQTGPNLARIGPGRGRSRTRPDDRPRPFSSASPQTFGLFRQASGRRWPVTPRAAVRSVRRRSVTRTIATDPYWSPARRPCCHVWLCRLMDSRSI